MTHHAGPPGAGMLVGLGAGEARWWFGGLATVKLLAKDTGGQFSLLEMLYPAGYEVLRHVHHREHEAFYVLDGEITMSVSDCTLVARPGSMIHVPRDVPHGFVVTSPGPARYLIVYSPAGFEGFVLETSEPARTLTLPPPADAPPEYARLNALMAEKYATDWIR